MKKTGRLMPKLSIVICICCFLSASVLYGQDKDSCRSKPCDKFFNRVWNLEMPEFPEIPDLSMLSEIPEMPPFPKIPVVPLLTLMDFDHEIREVIADLPGDKEEEKKTIRNSFSINDKTTISLTNKYGDIEIETWNNNTAEIRVEIIATATTSARALDILGKIDIKIAENKAENTLAIKTEILPNSKNIFNVSLSYSGDFHINYYVKIPAGNPLDVQNSFGDVKMPDYSGKLNLKVSYGKIEARTLHNPQTKIDLAFGKGHISAIPSGQVSVRYSNLNITSGKSLKLKNEFSNIKIANAENIEIDSRYGEVELGKVGYIKGSSRFSDFSIETLNKGAEMELQYCPDFRINQLERSFSKLNINMKFSELSIYVMPETSFNIDVAMLFGSLISNGAAKLNELEEDYGQKTTYTGSYGTNPNAQVTVNGQYSKVRIRPVN